MIFPGASFGGPGFGDWSRPISVEFALVGWLSEPSPITASSPCSAVLFGSPGDFGVSLDQNAQVDPAVGFVAGSGLAGGASLIIVSSGSFAGPESDSGAFTDSSLPAVGALLPDQNGSHMVIERCGPVVIGCSAASDATVLFSGGGSVRDRPFPSFGDGAFSCGVSWDSVGFFVGTGFDVNHPPSQPDDVAGLCGVSAAGGSCISTSAAGETLSFEVSPFASTLVSFEVGSFSLFVVFLAVSCTVAFTSPLVAGSSVSVSRTLGIVLTEA